MPAKLQDIPRLEAIVIGARFRGSYLKEQGDVTIGRAREEESLLKIFLPPEFLAILQTILANVAKCADDKTLVREESKQLTKSVTVELREAKVWRRQLVKMAANAAIFDKAIPDTLKMIGVTGSCVPRINSDLSAKIAAVNDHKDSLKQWGATDEFMRRGKQALADLVNADTKQELKVEDLPQATADYYYQKGLLYLGLKVINNAGQSAHSDDPLMAAKYNLNILHRKAAGKKNPEQSAEAKQ